MKHRQIFLIWVFLGILLLIIGLFWLRGNVSPISSDNQKRNVVIPKGYSTSQIALLLKNKGFIRSSLAFKVLTSLKGKTQDIQAGEYELSPNMSLSEVLDKLLKGPDEIWITIPEGLRREQVAKVFANGLGKTDQEKEIFVSEFLELTTQKEGFLFPDTYLFPKTASASMIVRTMLFTFDERIGGEILGTINISPYTLSQVITIASLVERETQTVEERAYVAGILIKRFREEWPLQVDATIQYALANIICKPRVLECNWWPILTKEDFDANSPYNTYKWLGLPPGPIANPGLSSIEAVVYPKKTDYWYYLHDREGQIYYAKTLEEHNQNIAKHLRK